ncbi:kelch-like protein 10 [Bacillus rossius redtenbacheri]|uniref:kelch-like protein 10 n=1 Tax=Bacillus rossius redtenbacheri TaxID=93214 RepID=UPI002FDDE112
MMAVSRRRAASYAQALHDMRVRGVLCDATLRLDDGASFRVHRAVLSASSSYFRALFTSATNSTTKKDVALHGINSTYMASIVRYAYLQQLDIKEETVLELLATADYLCIDGIVEKCLAFAVENLKPENCIGVLKFARQVQHE